MRHLSLLLMCALCPALATAQALTRPQIPERVWDTRAAVGVPMSIVQPIEADGNPATLDFLLHDDLRGEASTRLYYTVSVRADGVYCSAGWHPRVLAPPSRRESLHVWFVGGQHKLIAVAAKGVIEQWPVPPALTRCAP